MITKTPESESTKEPYGPRLLECVLCRAQVLHLWRVDGNASLCGPCADRMDECPHLTANRDSDECDYCGCDLILWQSSQP